MNRIHKIEKKSGKTYYYREIDIYDPNLKRNRSKNLGPATKEDYEKYLQRREGEVEGV